MSTSGIYRSQRDDEIDCTCGFQGPAEVTDDAEDRTLWWVCPECGHPGSETYGDRYDRHEDGVSQPLFVLTICLTAAAIFTAWGGLWQASLGALAVLTIIHGVARSGTERNEKP